MTTARLYQPGANPTRREACSSYSESWSSLGWYHISYVSNPAAVDSKSGAISVRVAITQLHQITKTLPFHLCIAVTQQSAKNERSQFRSRAVAQRCNFDQITRWVSRCCTKSIRSISNFDTSFVVVQFDDKALNLLKISTEASRVFTLCTMFPPSFANICFHCCGFWFYHVGDVLEPAKINIYANKLKHADVYMSTTL